MRIQGEGLADETGQGLEQSDKIIYILHSNCDPEDLGL